MGLGLGLSLGLGVGLGSSSRSVDVPEDGPRRMAVMDRKERTLAAYNHSGMH
jgi:hypothetical protein